jgi:hypothetical protein
MLRNYRPDHITTPDFRWRYVAAVKTEVKYGSQEVKNDLPSLQNYQNIIANGGVCGRRAFFGRFILRAFGIPTVARPQPGHATLCHWTPNGWVINLALDAVGQDIAEANVSKEKDVVVKVAVTEADKKIVVGPNGAITVPAVACSKPTGNTKTILFMRSLAGGMQLHYNRLGGEEAFEYRFDAPAAGKYALAARAVTVSPGQDLLVTPNDAKEPIAMAMPYTVGMWQKTEPVEITLVKGQNVLRFTRKAPYRGLTIKDFTLSPVK